MYVGGGRNVTCSGSATSSAGFHHNTAASGGAAYLPVTGLQLRSQTCDWASTSALQANRPQDILYVSTPYNYGENVSFTCRLGTCR
jgi:hypothetical protein